MARRSFEQAAVVATGVQTSAARFGGEARRRDDPSNYVSPWRCNLTALSQEHNLYFVAYAERIFVYIPQYRSQAVSEQPALIVASPPSTPPRPGYIDPRNPHAINNLVVQRLGNEEVIATVRDDGDVDAFLVRQIVNAIERRAEPGSTMSADAAEVRPFFQSNVGMSAWGLALHTNARILAVSANTHNLTIFKFGLVDANKSNDELDSDGEGEEGAQSHRKTDVTEQVVNGSSNIPHIAFCNTGDDPDARWLLTTDIAGFCRTLDLHNNEAVQIFRFGPRNMGSNAFTDHDRINSGWSIMFLDRRSFMNEETLVGALGLDDITKSLSISRSEHSKMWDIGQTVDSLPDASYRYTREVRRQRQSAARPSDPRDGPQEPRLDSSDSDTETDSDSGGVAIESAAEQDGGDHASDIEAVEDLDLGHASEEHDEVEDEDELDYYDSQDEGTEDTVSFSAMYGGDRIHGNALRAAQPNGRLCDDLPCPILHTSVRSVYLLQPTTRKGPTGRTFPPPTVGFTNALRQKLTSQDSWLNHIERLNMTAYIPQIGIVVIASQKGRAMVLSLTKIPNFRDKVLDDDKEYPKTAYTMRLEQILPLASQEAKYERPFEPLAGIATGPMQGTEKLPDEKKRWRLMMMYYDHSILSYEISRRSSRDSAIDIQGLVV